MSDSKRVLNVMFITPCFGVGGLEQVVMNVISCLDRSKVNPSFCSLLQPDHGVYNELKELDLPSYCFNKRKGIDYFLTMRLRNILVREKIDLINSHDIGATLYAAVASRLCAKKRIVHTDHSQILTKSRYLRLYRWLMRHWVDFSITVSHELERYLTDQMKICRNQVMTIPNGIDVDKFKSSENVDYLRGEFRIENDEKVIGSIGRLTEQKGYEYLLRAFQLVLTVNPQTTLLIVGDGDLSESLKELARELGIEGKVVFAGIRKDIANLLKLFDVFVLSSLWEGQPITIMEAMAAGKAIVVTDVGGNSEILDDGKYGVLVPSKDPVALAASINKVLTDREFAERLGRAARIYSKDALSHFGMAKRYQDVFLSVMGQES